MKLIEHQIKSIKEKLNQIEKDTDMILYRLLKEIDEASVLNGIECLKMLQFERIHDQKKLNALIHKEKSEELQSHFGCVF